MGKAAPRRKRWPVVVVTTRRTLRNHKFIDYVGEFHLELLVKQGLFPAMVPVVQGSEAMLAQFEERMDGLLITEGEDIEPHHYRHTSANRRYLQKTHALKDKIEMELVRRAIKRGIPVMGICRGAQILNVAAGGTLFGDVQKEKKSRRPHVMHGARYDSYRHPVTLMPGTPMAAWYGRGDLKVNSYHHQGVRDLAPRFRAMAYADDGLVEAFYDPASSFTVGLQYHPERMLSEYKGNLRVWQAFAQAVHACAHKI